MKRFLATAVLWPPRLASSHILNSDATAGWIKISHKVFPTDIYEQQCFTDLWEKMKIISMKFGWNLAIYIDKPVSFRSLPAARMKEEMCIRASNTHWSPKSQFFLRGYFQPENRISTENATLIWAQYCTDLFSRVLQKANSYYIMN